MLDYGIVGNCKTCALVSKKASVDWLCFPDFDSSSAFAKILDKKGGSFEIKTKGSYKIRQEYIDKTNILKTTFISKDASFEVIDFFPRYKKLLPNKKKKVFRQNKFVRIVRRIKGRPVLKYIYDPKPDYARAKIQTEEMDGKILTRNGESDIYMGTNIKNSDLLSRNFVKLDSTHYFTIGEPTKSSSIRNILRLYSATKKYWESWTGSLILPKKNRETIIRSALVLKLLTYSETGAIIAAATTSIPEEIGSHRTWDYRFCWIRDAIFTIDTLKKIGRDHEARKLFDFIFECAKKKNIQIMYGIRGETDLKEMTLDHLEGFKYSRPVRIGNGAAGQMQNDIYGTIIDALYLFYVYYEYEKTMPKKFWSLLLFMVKKISGEWNKKDNGIWEMRGKKEHFTYSKMMCHIGIDRAIRIAQHFGRFNLALRWVRLREEIRNDLFLNAWNNEIKAFTISYGSRNLDSAVLLMAYHQYLDLDDPRLISTVNLIDKELRDGAYVKRYDIKDHEGKMKNSFTVCSFWLVDALYVIGEVGKARKLYRSLQKYSNHLGLYSEDIDAATGKLLGNFPQAYTHLALINSSILLSEWNSKRKKLHFKQSYIY